MSVLSALQQALTTASVRVVDLTAPLSEKTPILQLPPPFANTVGLSRRKVSEFDDGGPAWAWYDLTIGEHAGTHIDAPAHWITGRGGKSVEQLEPARLVGPAVVIDLSQEAEANNDVLLEPAHIQAWEAKHGPLPQGCWILLRTGWATRAHDTAQFLNADASGPHTPGPSVAAAKFMAEHPAISGFGVETVGIDAGSAGGMEPGFPAHHYLLGNDKYGLTSLQNLDQLPEQGATIIVAPLPIVGGTGSPSRVYALVEG